MTEIQEKLLEEISFFHTICTDYGLRYYVCGGTLLGAVRHHGFIPWDDDIDVWMPRPDYEKLKVVMSINNSSKYVFEAPGLNDGHHYYAMGKLYDTTTTAVEETKFNVKKGIYIDIFPLDGLGSTNKEWKFFYTKMHFLNLVLASRISVPRKERSSLKNGAIRISSLIPERLLNTERLIGLFDRACQKYSYESSKYTGVLMGSYGMRDVVEKSIFDNPVLYDFETTKVYGVADYDKLLTHIFGNWRQLPPIEKQVSHHDFSYLDLNHGYFE